MNTSQTQARKNNTNAVVNTVSHHRRTHLLEALEVRIDALTNGLHEAAVTDKGIDLVKEMKELHTLLEALQLRENGGEGGARAEDRRIVVVWGGEK